MNVKNTIIVTGIRKFKGEIDGKEHDFTKINYVPVDNYLSNDREIGYFPTEILAGTSSSFDELSKHNYPCIFEVELSINISRKGQTNVELKNYKYIKDLAI